MKQFVQNEEAVSPVIGVILMVAITVILAAVIAAFVFGMTGNMPASTKNVVVQPKIMIGQGAAATDDGIRLTIQGGTTADIKSLSSLRVSVATPSTAITLTKGTGLNDPASAAGAANPGVETFPIADLNALGVGSTFDVKTDLATADDGPFEVTVTAIFSDGTEQMVISPAKL